MPPVCGLELLDVIDFTDPLIQASAVVRRVMEITWKLDRPKQLYEQHLALGPM